MFARVSNIRGTPEKMQRAAAELRDRLIPAISQHKGFNGGLIFVNFEKGNVLVVTYWDTAEDMAASASVADKLRGQALDIAGGVAPPEVETYETIRMRAQVPG